MDPFLGLPTVLLIVLVGPALLLFSSPVRASSPVPALEVDTLRPGQWCRRREKDSAAGRKSGTRAGAVGGRLDGIPPAGCKAAHFDREEIPAMATGRT